MTATRRDARVGQQQAKLYADCLEQQFGQRPVIFYSNGYDPWIWDDARYPPRRVQGFYKKAELELLSQRRSTRRPLAQTTINSDIVERPYQSRAIRRIAEAFERDHDRKALLVMATGAGKTRTVIALCDLLMRCNWAKRVLFLADRVALVNQAVNAFKRHLPDAAPVNLVTEKGAEGRVFVSTYPTMMGLIDESAEGQRRFGVGHFDLVIIDEAHRSVFQKYRAIFDYFDSLLKEIAGLLEEKAAIPMVNAQMALIQDLQTDEWWQDVTVPMLEVVRRRLRDLVQLIDKLQRKAVYTDFEDVMGGETGIELPGFSVGTDRAKFVAKARVFLRQHLDHVVIAKLRLNKPLTASDLGELERMLGESGLGAQDELKRTAEESQGLGLFVRSLVGMDRGAAKEAMAGFLTGKTLAANQIEFVNLVIDHLTEHGIVKSGALYESPFTDLAPRGPDALFGSAEIDELIQALDTVQAMAQAA